MKNASAQEIHSARGQQSITVPLILLALLPLLVFWPVSQHDYINLDDTDYITENGMVQKGLSWQGIRWAFKSGHAANWHPLTWISHMIDWEMHGNKPGPQHLTNVAFHIANTLLLFLTLKKLTKRVESSPIWPCAMVAAVFALHPLHVESVAWLAERKDVLSTFFGMLMLWAYAGYVDVPSEVKGKKTTWYLITIFVFSLGLLAKPMLVTLPCVMLLLDFWPMQRFSRRNAIRLVVEKVPFVLLTAASSVITFFVQREAGAVSTLDHIPIGLRISNSLIGYCGYLAKMIVPTDLAILYPYQYRWSMALTLGAALLLSGITIIVIVLRRSKPYLAVGWFWFLGMLVPVIGLVQVGTQSMADRYTYVPLVGIFIMLVWLARDLFDRSRTGSLILKTVALGIIAACCAATSNQLRYWKNSLTLFSHTLAVTKNNPVAHNYFATALALNGQISEALHHHERSIALFPNYADAHYNYGYTLLRLRREAEAILEFETTLRLNPKHRPARSRLGTLLAKAKRYEGAAFHFAEYLESEPNDLEIQYNMANALIGQGKLQDAIPYLASVVGKNPNDREALEKLGVTLMQIGKPAEAAEYFTKIIKATPHDAIVHYYLGLTFAMRQQSKIAVEYFRRALRLQPDLPAVLNDLAWVLATDNDASVRNGTEAVQLAEKACVLAGNIAQFFGTLDAAYAESGDFTKAIATAEKAEELARKESRPEIAAAAQARIRLYRSHQPFRQPAQQ